MTAHHCPAHPCPICYPNAPTLTVPDKREDRAYRNGYMQAWREWSACVKPDGVSEWDRVALEHNRRAIEAR